MKLDTYQEIIGTLVKYSFQDDAIHLEFNMRKNIEVPKQSFSEKQLSESINKRIAIVDRDGYYFLKRISKSE